jgi:3-oxoacyl-[acyl-carrier protein] reductase
VALAEQPTLTVGNASFDFSGRTIIVTGAARGIGLEVARRFGAAGAAVYLVYFDGEEAEKAAVGFDATAVQADVSDTAAVEDAVARAVSDIGRLDVVVNNAGLLRDRVLWKMTDDDWNCVLAVQADGTFRFTRAAVPHFRERGCGRIVNVTSYTALHSNIGQGNYGTAKAGIIGFTKAAAKELARFGITVNAIGPNAETRMIARVPDEKCAEPIAGIPIGRLAAPGEMLGATAFLAFQEVGYITGTVLPVDGGLSM